MSGPRDEPIRRHPDYGPDPDYVPVPDVEPTDDAPRAPDRHPPGKGGDDKGDEAEHSS